jgi:hypothetical protein
VSNQSMTRTELIRLGVLQANEYRSDRKFLPEEKEELRALRNKLARVEAEVADDKSTLLVNEARSPNLADDGDYRQQQLQRSCDEALDFAIKLAERVGEAAAQAALQAAMNALAKR